MTWTYKGNPIESVDEVDVKGAVGFIYIITQVSTGKRYLGKKLLTKAGRKTVNGKTKKIRVDSDWQNYWSSSPLLKEMVEEHGKDDFTREIIQFVTSKGMLAYAEEMALYQVGALESDKWINNNIRSKVYRSWCKPEEAKELREKIQTLI